MPLPVRTHSTTHVGLVHQRNEDSLAIEEGEDGGLMLLVCDGMGGMGRGDIASALAVKEITQRMITGDGFPQDRIRRAIRQTDRIVRDELCSSGDGLPGATAVLVYLLDGQAHVGWVGDSRAYLVRGRRVLERTRDHKLVEELVEAGQLTADQAKDSSLAHVITQALGGRPPGDRPVKATLLGHPWKLAHGDRIVLCSDGVSDLVEDDELADVVSDGTPEDATYKLLEMSLARGGHDNITAIVLSWDGEDYVEDDVATPAFISREAYPDTDLLRATGKPPTPDDGPPGTVTEEIDPSWRPDDDDEEDTGITSRMIFGDPDAAKPPADSAAETWPPAPPPVSAEDGEHDQGTDQTIESSSSETTANWMLYVAGIVAVLVVFGLVLGLR